jgi:hypothetical protein
MHSLKAEVIGKFDRAHDASRLLYAPLDADLTARETRTYQIDYEGDGAALAAFLTRVLADPISHELFLGDNPAISDFAFYLDYGMKAGALDLEKETILAHHRGDTASGFKILKMKIARRVYIFDQAKSTATAALAGRFVKDIVNPAIHAWTVTAA